MPGLSLPEMHGALTHFPVALITIACAYEVGALVFRKPEWRPVSFWILVAAVVLTLPTLVTGWLTADRIFAAGRPPAVFTHHRAAGLTTAGLAFVLLAWRVAGRDRLSGVQLAASVILTLVTAGVVGYTGFLGGQLVFGGSPAVASTMPAGMRAHGRAHVSRRQTSEIAAGARLFGALHCQSCHSMAGQGARAAPDLTREGERHPDEAWQIAHLKDPQRATPGSGMPSFDYLRADQLHALAAYLASRH